MPPPEHRRPFPDAAHEALAVWVEEALADLSTSQADLEDSLLLVDVLFGLIDQTRADHDALAAQVAALEALAAPPPPDAPPVSTPPPEPGA